MNLNIILIYDRMEELVSSASQPLYDGSQPPLVDIDTLYFEAAGGEKRRRAYGLGSRAAFIYHSSCQSIESSHSSASAARVREIVQQELADKKAEMDRAIAELTAERESFHEMQEQMTRFIEQMQSSQQFNGLGSSSF